MPSPVQLSDGAADEADEDLAERSDCGVPTMTAFDQRLKVTHVLCKTVGSSACTQ